MKKTVLLLCLSFLAMPAWAQSIEDTQIKEVSNRVLLGIYNSILNSKSQFPELASFSKDALTKDRRGIYIIQYSSPSEKTGEGQMVRFGLTIAGIDDRTSFDAQSGAFNYGFPILNVKFSGYEQQKVGAKSFSIQEPIQNFGQTLWDYQQEFMPLQLVFKPDRTYFRTGENIAFTVTLKNASKKNIKVKDLNSQTLYFLYNNQPWGAVESSPNLSKNIKEVLLGPGKSLSKNFVGNGFRSPQEFQIFGSYVMTFKGVKPVVNLQISVVE